MPVAQTLMEAAQFVLETMFFAESEAVTAPGSFEAGQVAVRISFHGPRCGHLTIGMPEAFARAMAGSFEGLPETENIPAAAVDQVAAELANMICGATLTRLDEDGLFTLHSPALLRDLPLSPADTGASGPVSDCWLRIPYMGEGLMHLALAVGDVS